MATQQLLVRKDATLYRLPCDAGAAFMNEDNISVKQDRGISKIRNLDPQDFKILKTWGQINQANVSRLSAKLAVGSIGRNGMDGSPRLDLPAAWHMQKLLDSKIGSRFVVRPVSVAWGGTHCRKNRSQQAPLEPVFPPSAAAAKNRSVGSATELVGSSSSSASTSNPRAAAQPSLLAQPCETPFEPRSKAMPVQKQTTSSSVFC